MKKIIIFIIYSVCLLATYFVNYTSTYTSQQYETINEAIKVNNNDFFLKFNDYYNNIFESNDLYIYEAVNDDVLSYSFIIKNLNKDVISTESNTYNKLIISNEQKSFTYDLYMAYYFNTPLYSFNITYDELTNEIGNNITNIKFINSNNEQYFNYEFSLELEEYTYDNFNEGYSKKEINNLYSINNLKPVYMAILYFHITFIVLLGIIMLFTFINNKKNFI